MANGVVVVRDIAEQVSNFSVRVAGASFEAAYSCLDERVILYRPSDKRAGGYVGSATIVNVQPYRASSRLMLDLADVDWFDEPVPLQSEGVTVERDLMDSLGNLRFQALAPGLRQITSITLLDILDRGQRPLGNAESPQAPYSVPHQHPAGLTNTLEPQWRSVQTRVRQKLRKRCLDLYDWRCMLSGRRLDLSEGGSLLTVSHFHPLGRGGPDDITNVGLKTAALHAMYEPGLFTIQPSGRILFAPDMSSDLQQEFRGRTEADFPGNRQFWPRQEYLHYHRVEIYEARLRKLGL